MLTGLIQYGAVHIVRQAEGGGGLGQSVTSNDEGMGKSVTRGWGVLKMVHICVTYFMDGP